MGSCQWFVKATPRKDRGVVPGTGGQAREFLKSQVARGGTILRPAITAAYGYHDSDRVLNVVILSDGMTEQSEQSELVLIVVERLQRLFQNILEMARIDAGAVSTELRWWATRRAGSR